MRTRRFQESYTAGLKRQICFIEAGGRPRCELCSLRGPAPDVCHRHAFRVDPWSVCNEFKGPETSGQKGKAA